MCLFITLPTRRRVAMILLAAVALSGPFQTSTTAEDVREVGPAVINPDLQYCVRPRADLDEYGGWRGLQGQKTGFFHVEKIGGRWWFVTPAGNVYFALGATMHAKRHGMSREEWERQQIGRLRSWGFNCADEKLRPAPSEPGLPYTINCNLARLGGPPLPIPLTPGLPPWSVFPDVFDPAWPQRCQEHLDKTLKPLADDPMLIGFYLDNEVCLGGWYEAVTNTDLESPARKAFVEVARQYYADKPDQLASDWKQHSVATIDDLMKVKGSPPSVPALKAAWNRAVAERYFGGGVAACKKAAPKHLCLGIRMYNAAPPPPEILAVMSKYCDVISMNLYSPYPDRMLTHVFTLVPMMYGALQRPFMTSEFSYRGGDTAHPNTQGAPPTVPTQTDRGVGYLSYVASMASLPFYIGTVWFCYGDQETQIKWKGYGEDCNYGMIDGHNHPYAVLTEIMRQTNASIYELAADPIKSKNCPLFWRTELLRWDRQYDQRMLKEYGRIDAPPDPFTAMLKSDRQFHHTYWITHQSPSLIVNDLRFFGACQANMIRSTPEGHELVLIGCRGLMTMPKRLWYGDQCTNPDESLPVESNAQVLVRRLDKVGRVRQITLVDGSFFMTDFTRMELRCPGKVPYLDLRFDPDAKALTITSRGSFDRLGLRDVADWKVTWGDKPARVLKPEEYAAPDGMTVFGLGT